ncbi:hypothetical protein [Steroidobacter cummioxidans]|uniref:hypothetical protein n=1 Tax=Steroidobacter cummioxidans TaxID=1803913 RepID=UPI0019D43142|nr:hypothetical protein [Steroidobacter cummioxidans]
MSRAGNKSYRLPSKRVTVCSFAAAVLWWVLMVTGMRLPYLQTHLAFQLRVFVLFPLFASVLAYFSFFFRGKLLSSGYELRMGQLATRKDRVKSTLWGLFGLVLISGGVAWTSIGFPAWATDLVAKEVYSREYIIESIEVRGGPLWSTMYHLRLRRQGADETVMLPLKRMIYEQARWKRGQSVCVHGRSWILGTIIDDVSPDTESCANR